MKESGQSKKRNNQTLCSKAQGSSETLVHRMGNSTFYCAVAEQTGPVHMAPRWMTQQLTLEGTGLYLQYSSLEGAQSMYAWSVPFPRDPALPLFPETAISQKQTQ